MVEFALLLPWYVFLFVGAYDFGFISYGMVATQNAARVAAVHCSGSASLASNCNTLNAACNYALDQLRMMPNVGSSMVAPCAAPVVITTSELAAGSSPDLLYPAVQVTVAYTTPTLIPIPGLLPGTLTITRTVQMRVLT